MHSLDMLIELFQHMHWADAKIWDTVLSLPDVEQNDQLKNSLYHLHITQYPFHHILKSHTPFC